MRCEPRVWVRFLCCANLFFCVFLCVSVFYEFMCIAFSRLPVSPCVCVCVCASVSVRLAEVDEKARVWLLLCLYKPLARSVCKARPPPLTSQTHTFCCSFPFHMAPYSRKPEFKETRMNRAHKAATNHRLVV